jgi:hypothetical protein
VTRRSGHSALLSGAAALTLAALAAPAATAQMRALQAEIDALGGRVERLHDLRQIERLQSAYGYYVDVSQFYDVVDLFAWDSRVEIGGRGVFLGKPHVYAYMEQLGTTMAPAYDVMYTHQQLQPLITVAEDGRTAQARWAPLVMAGSVWGDVTYENAYVKEDGVWKIQSLKAPFNMYTEFLQGWAKYAEPNTRPESWLPPPDLPPSAAYLTYPNFHIEPYHFANPVTGRMAPPPNPAAGGVAAMTAVLRAEDAE